MTMRIKGLRARRVEQLVMALRAAMTATTARAEAIADERIDVCRTA
jgi:hypothetical protein